MQKEKLVLRIVVAAILLIPPSLSWSQSVAKYAGEFISVGTGSRALGMGSAYAAIAEGSIASYWNPAGLVQLEYPEIQLMYAERFKGVVKYNYATAAIPFGSDAALAIGLMRTGVDDIPITALPDPGRPPGSDNRPYVERRVDDSEYAVYFSYAGRWKSSRALGGNIKFIRKSVGDNSAWGLGFDLGFLTNLAGDLKLGINVQDITTTLVAWDTGEKELIAPNVKWGLAYQYRINSLDIVPTIDIDTRFEGRRFASQANVGAANLDFHAGLEVAYRKLIHLRVGSDIGRLTAGIGLQIPRLQFDAAFMNHQDLGETYRISATVALKRPNQR